MFNGRYVFVDEFFCCEFFVCIFFFKQKTAYEMRISDWSSDVCSSDLKKLYPNVDFYSGIILSAIGFPTTMFTVLFALARTVGWVAQWNEMIEDPAQKIGRPRQLYTGHTQRDYVPVDKR